VLSTLRQHPMWLTAILALAAYLAGLHWIYISLHVYGLMPSWLAGLATVLLSAYVAGYAVAAIAVCRWLRLSPTSITTAWVIAAVATLAEWLRGTIFTGFPWLSVGYFGIDTPLVGFAPWLGVYGVGLMVVAGLVLLTQCLRFRQWRFFISLIAVIAVGWSLQMKDYTSPHGRPLRVGLIQGAIPQSMKFDPSREAQAIATQLAIARSAAVPGGPQLIVFPETALVRPWDLTIADTRQAFHRLAQQSGATVMLGLPLRDPDGYRNSLIAIDDQSPPEGFSSRYDKYHLVPFGEFIPFGFRWFVDMMQMPLGDFQRGAAVQTPIGVRDQRIGVNICYEDLFGEEIIRALHPNRTSDAQPTVLLNVSNLAWFGNTIALDQHLTIARMRSIETGRPSLRATNTGATAAIDHRGRVLDQLPHGEPGLLLTQVQGMQGNTPYSRWGNSVVLMGAALLAGLGLVRRLRLQSAKK
jgi:apolipoprotein N-acyltransferase